MEKSVSKEKGEFIMTTMERWMNESYHKGVQEIADLLIKD
ncbi:Uncharacterized protein dnl_05370 [Desulfonema limicola]|uniref:Uncharacterized protein n=1 Tax=Desulfonema limicola TaxID=45656 RepID=A0A975B3W8_9BACT|nr:Uncharacterized protein dnl_05370 [Desulfonema limicola]